jgi:hypothetical protein
MRHVRCLWHARYLTLVVCYFHGNHSRTPLLPRREALSHEVREPVGPVLLASQVENDPRRLVIICGRALYDIGDVNHIIRRVYGHPFMFSFFLLKLEEFKLKTCLAVIAITASKHNLY